MNECNQQLLDYIAASPTAFHAAAHTAGILERAGYTRLNEGAQWSLEPGKGYFVTRNGSSLIAFRVPEGEWQGFLMAAAHGDSPAFKIKENAELPGEHYVRLSTEKYGGMLCASWMDRPLSIAGRVTVRTNNGIQVRLTDLREPCAIIPNVAIHMDRAANDGKKYDPAVDMLPLLRTGGEGESLRAWVAAAAGVDEGDLLTTDLFVYNPQRGEEWGGLLSAPRLDDLQCAFAALTAFMQAESCKAVPVYSLFDNEEVGSETKQGAASTFLADTLARVAGSAEALRCQVAHSFLVSCDNAHAVHPNHPEYQDKNHAVHLNGGVVVKYNANQRYTTDAVSAAVFALACEKAGVPVQRYANRADMAGGSTLGNIANTQVSLNTVDVGLAQLAMHSAFETAGAADTELMIRALTAFYASPLRMDADGSYTLG